MPVDKIISDYKDIRKRLINPPNAVPDPGIDLTRKSTAYKGDIPPPGTPPKKPLIPPKVYEEIVLPINFDDIVNSVSVFYKIPTVELRGDCRRMTYVMARRIIVWLSLRLLTTRSLTQIGRDLCKDHTTIVHAKRKIQKDLESDENLRSQVSQIEESIRVHHRHRLAASTLSESSLEVSLWPGHQFQGIP